jgi:hypothetical protein
MLDVVAHMGMPYLPMLFTQKHRRKPIPYGLYEPSLAHVVVRAAQGKKEEEGHIVSFPLWPSYCATLALPVPLPHIATIDQVQCI